MTFLHKAIATATIVQSGDVQKQVPGFMLVGLCVRWNTRRGAVAKSRDNKSSKTGSGRRAAVIEDQGARVERFLRSRLASEADAQDLAQEAYLRLLRVKDPKLIQDPVAYLFRIARNLVHEWYTSLPPPSDSIDDVEIAEDGMSIEALAESGQQMDRLKQVMAHLSPKCRAAIVMHRRDGMTYEEIAKALGVSTAMVKKYLSQGLARCRARLRKYHE